MEHPSGDRERGRRREEGRAPFSERVGGQAGGEETSANDAVSVSIFPTEKDLATRTGENEMEALKMGGFFMRRLVSFGDGS